eukprot:GHUV01027523.1.p1 GENE.GHUV01027523.1~~GHUV01027523.1.p1  ORF type:complete len:112 (+),score=26.96 GHUV01027523.1:961-1296(+)
MFTLAKYIQLYAIGIHPVSTYVQFYGSHNTTCHCYCCLLLLQIIVFCCAHADQIKSHLADSKWLKQKSPRVVTVTSTNCLSLGEAMRSLDQKDIIKSTFILVSGEQQHQTA